MKLSALLFFLTGFVAMPAVHATINNGYANAYLDLTSSNQSETATANSTDGVGFTDAAAQPGAMTNSLLTQASAGGASTSFQNESVSGFSDTFTINGPGLTGSAGTLHFNFTINGVFSASSTPPGVGKLTATYTFTDPGSNSESFSDTDGAISGTDFLGVPQTYTVPFTFGTPFKVTLSLDITANVSGLTAGSAMASGTFNTVASTSNVMASVEQAPLSSSQYTAKTASGNDYFTTTAVPEPADVSLLLAGVALLPFVRRFRRTLS